MDSVEGDTLNSCIPPTPGASAMKGRRKAPAKITHKWSEEETLKLISAVEQKPAIWNFGCTDYSKAPVRDAAWRAIVADFDNCYDLGELAAKWQNLRTSFRKECAKLKKTKSGQATTNQVKWRLYEAMHFVDVVESDLNTISESNLAIETVFLFIKLINIFSCFH